MATTNSYFEMAIETYLEVDSKLTPMLSDYSEHVKKIDVEKTLSAFDIVLQYSLLDTALAERKLIEDEASFIQRIARHGSLVRFLSRQTGMNYTWHSLFNLTEKEIARIIEPFSQKVVNNAIDMSNVLIDVIKILGETEGQKFFTYLSSKLVHVVTCLVYVDNSEDNEKEMDVAFNTPIFTLLSFVADNSHVKIPSFEEVYEINFGKKPPEDAPKGKIGSTSGGRKSPSTGDTDGGKSASLRPSGGSHHPAPSAPSEKPSGPKSSGGDDSGASKPLTKGDLGIGGGSSRSEPSFDDFFVKKSTNKDLAINYEQKELGVAFIETDTGTGSGFVINEDGLVFTCNHVIEDTKFVNVYLMDKDEVKHKYEAKVVYFDKTNDRACVQIKASGEKFHYFELEDDYKTIKAGDDVAVFGYPFGLSLNANIEELAPTLTKGYIGSKNKVDGKLCYYLDIRSAPGYSGGPTFRLKDNKVIGYLCGSYGSDRANLVYIRPLQEFLKFFK